MRAYDTAHGSHRILDEFVKLPFGWNRVEWQHSGGMPDPAFAEAAGLLEMIAKNPEERRLYEARLKMQRDEQARLEYAIEQGELRGREVGFGEGFGEGLEEGREEGRMIGRIQLLQQLLNLPESSVEELQGRSVEELAALEQDLQRQLRNRG